MVAIATISIVVAVIVDAAIAMVALVVVIMVLLVLLLTLLHDGSKDLGAQDLLMLIVEILVGWGVLPVASALPISKPVSLTQSFHGRSDLGGNYGLALIVAVSREVLLAAATKTINPLDLARGWSSRVLGQGLLGPTRVGSGGRLDCGTRDHGRDKRDPISGGHVLLQIQTEANPLLLALVSMIKDNLKGSMLYITRSINTLVEVRIIPLDVFLDLSIQCRKVRWTQVLTVVIYISGMKVTSDVPELRVVHVDGH